MDDGPTYPEGQNPAKYKTCFFTVKPTPGENPKKKQLQHDEIKHVKM